LYYSAPNDAHTNSNSDLYAGEYMNLVNEDGHLISKTITLGNDAYFDIKLKRVILYAPCETNLCLKIWYPFQNKEKLIYVNRDKAFKKIPQMWK
jgi:hypothetical protein